MTNIPMFKSFGRGICLFFSHRKVFVAVSYDRKRRLGRSKEVVQQKKTAVQSVQIGGGEAGELRSPGAALPRPPESGYTDPLAGTGRERSSRWRLPSHPFDFTVEDEKSSIPSAFPFGL